MIFYLRAKYHANLNLSHQYEDYIQIAKDSIRTVRIRQKMFGRVEVQVMRDDKPEVPLHGARILYSDLFLFFMDWEPLHVATLPDKFQYYFNKGTNDVG